MSLCFFECQFYFAAADPTPVGCQCAAAGAEGSGLGAMLLAVVRLVLAGLARCCTRVNA